MPSHKWRTAYIDKDGLLADFHRAAALAHGRDFSTWPRAGAELAGLLGFNYNTSQGFKDFWEPIRYNVDFWSGIKPFPWVGTLLRLAEEYASEVVICTGPASKTSAEVAGKLDWLRERGIDFEVIICSKKERLAAPDCLLIDDWERHVDRFKAAGGQSILFPQPWNRDHAIVDPIRHVRSCLDALPIS